ncbi:hypothetical protein XACJK4_250041 [Xanthomonas citri pv. citri]|nr:hypothetical protein XAC1083_110041 [Xanthomonas citri pv. citri]CEE44169.1 hypothetical protein XAC9322_90041 [Xanthomonas citri pv. citri]CEE64041.1 hypothetical protein XACLC80_110041 [Xanthomonas citri pv. citri]CEF43265.1 hypothetical protein XAC217_100041 [Xanthomonas citri pv. citri]CEH45734.1 hypothetical protein XAC3610_1050003 [Xanthomonas citri pv. citri]
MIQITFTARDPQVGMFRADIPTAPVVALRHGRKGWNWNRGQPRVRWGSVRVGSRGTAGPYFL